MTFIEAFRLALGGALVRRRWWHESAYVAANTQDYHLERVPPMRNWDGPFSPTLDDVEATDWEEQTTAVEMLVERL